MFLFHQKLIKNNVRSAYSHNKHCESLLLWKNTIFGGNCRVSIVEFAETLQFQPGIWRSVSGPVSRVYRGRCAHSLKLLPNVTAGPGVALRRHASWDIIVLRNANEGTISHKLYNLYNTLQCSTICENYEFRDPATKK